ncbi:hypothetical protein [Nocardia otitidiscaviarum]|uniref:hypothetical protein n=1 Tax=Nocardia otitidiscaviarum TaxID=1823 RepID=UPI0004A700B3|nr:hypothetical protein [Nocardia otitidiscaviarum]
MNTLAYFLEVLLDERFPQPAGVREVAEHVVLTHHSSRAAYLERVIAANPAGTRVAEVAYDLLLGVTGRWDEGAES